MKLEISKEQCMRLAELEGDSEIGAGVIDMSLTEAQIKHMVNRFLGWQLPANFAPDAGIKYTRPNYPASWPGPSGTNLLDYTQAEAMVRHMIDGLPR